MDKEYWDITDFEYVSCGDAEIFADRCRVFKGIGVLLYKNNEIISKIDAPVEDVQLVKMSDIIEHYYVKCFNFKSIYFKKIKKETKQYEIGTEVITNDNDLIFKLTAGLSKHLHMYDSLCEELRQNDVWIVEENIGNTVLKIVKEKIERYIDIKDVASLKELKERAIQYRELDEFIEEKRKKS